MNVALGCRLLCAALLTFTVNAQEYYRWHDNSGQLHVSQTPPSAGIDYEIVDTQAKSAVTKVKATAVAAPVKPLDAKQIAALNQQVEQVNQQLKQQNCQQARTNKERLTAEAPVSITNAEGAEVALTMEMRAEQLVVTEQHIREFCQPDTPAPSKN